MTDQEIIQVIQTYKQDAQRAKDLRDRLTERNLRAFQSDHDWSHKTEGQSAEFIPKLSSAVEHFTNAVKRGLVDFGDWFSVDVSDAIKSIIREEDIRRIILCQLNTVSLSRQGGIDFPVVMADAIKDAILSSLIILKVHGEFSARHGMFVEAVDGVDKIEFMEKSTWHLNVDVIESKDYFPDPTGRHLYEIHHIERDWHELKALADEGVYEVSEVNRIRESMLEDLEQKKKSMKRNEKPEQLPSNPRLTVQLDECWGTLIDEDGRVFKHNCVTTIANEKFVIRKPEDNRKWHGQSPFVVCPLIRLPHTVWHRAMADDAAPLNILITEIMNLVVDAGLSSVHGIKQWRPDVVNNPEKYSNGIPVGETVEVNSNLAQGQSFMQRVDSGDIPNDAFNALGVLSREFETVMQVNDVRLGQLPGRNVRATEIIESRQGIESFADGVIRDVEVLCMQQVLWKAWSEILQNFDDIEADHLLPVVDANALRRIFDLSAAERFSTMMGGCQFTVRGLSETIGRGKELQKLLAVAQTVSTNPVLLEVFNRKYDAEKYLDFVMKAVNLDPTQLTLSEEEQQQAGQRANNIRQLASLTRGGESLSQQDIGDASLASQINQNVQNPLGGEEQLG